MREFSATDLGNKTGDVLAAASQEPIAIARHGKARFVVLTTETFQRLKTSADPRIARRTADIPTDEGAALVAELDRIIESDD
ncbi:type II toxin-antitoxin system prevent-host-death family antitoxin [Halovulum sp. GXIMD14793]